MLLQIRRIVAEVGVPASDIEPSSWLEHPRRISEPRVEKFVESHVGHEVIGQWAIPGPQLLATPIGLPCCIRCEMHVLNGRTILCVWS
jgi:hypothetical protein